jgi:hypothetical protein
MSELERRRREELDVELAADDRFERALVWRELLVIVVVAAMVSVRWLPL